MRDRVLLFLKGMCMGFADVIPGVSGGTMALVLGVYKEFVDTLRGLNLRWVGPLWRWVSGGRQADDLAALREELDRLNLLFLITLGLGIVTAVLVGSTFIPFLIENYPAPTRAFFFGLIVASVWVPVQMIRQSTGDGTAIAAAVLLSLAGVGFGYWVTNPASAYEGARESIEVTSSGETLKKITRRGPTSGTAEQIYWAPENEALREAVAAASPEKAAELEQLHAAAGEAALDKKALKARSRPYQSVEVPEGVEVTMPRPRLWFIAVAGAVAICAMILPGISGSYILLIFGVYFFILNALKGSIGLLVSGTLPTTHVMYLGVFGVALVAGILSFARVLSYLLERHAAPTLGALVGLMVGCLRGIWPFQQTVEGALVNIAPSASYPGFGGIVFAALAGFALVAALTVVGQRFDGGDEAATE